MKKKKGAVFGLGFVIFILVAFIIVFFMLEVYNMFNAKDKAQITMTRAVNVAMEMSFRDDIIAQTGGTNGISSINETQAKQEFYKFLMDDDNGEGLVQSAYNASRFEKRDTDGNVLYYYIVDELTIDDGLVWNGDGSIDFNKTRTEKEGPRIEVKGSINMPPLILETYLGNCDASKDYTVSVPFKAVTRNRKEAYRLVR